MRRFGRLLAGLLATAALMGVVGVGESGATPVLFTAAVCGGAVWGSWSWLQRRRPTKPEAWTTAEAFRFQAASAQAPGTPLAVTAALSRVEGRELASSPAMGAGLAFCALAVFAFAGLWAADFEGDVSKVVELGPILTHPLAGMIVLGAHRARTRSRRDGTQELFESCPTTEATRTAGHLGSAWVPGLVALVFLVALVLLVTWRSPVTWGELGARQATTVAGATLLPVGATALGVTLARWARWTVVPVVAVVGVGAVSVQLSTAGERTTDPARQLSTWLVDPIVDVRFTAPHWLAHHAWILALVVLVAVLGILRDRRTPALGALLAGAALLAAVSGVAATRPIDPAAAERIAALIASPADHQDCADAAGLPVCTYEGDGELARHIADAVAPVVAAAPPDALRGWVVRHHHDVDRTQLDPEVRALLDRASPMAERRIPMELQGHQAAEEGARFWTALTAVGVTEDHFPGTHLSLRGRARGVVALWLATRDLDASTARAMTTAVPGADPAGLDATRPWPDTCFAGPSPVTWALTDLEAARQVIALPEAAVRQVLHERWGELTDPTTTTDALLAALGLAPIGEVAGSTPPAGAC